MEAAEILGNSENLKRRKAINIIMLTLSVISALAAIIPLVYIFFYTAAAGISSINLDFFTELPKPVGETGGGIANAIIGSIEIVGIGAAFGIPVGLLAGIYVAEYSKTMIANLVKFVTDVLSGIPSIIVGIFAYGVIVLQSKNFSAYAGGFALGILMIPTVTRMTEEMLKLVPLSLREASLALGIPRWKTTLRIVLRTASGGIITGILLAVARAAGETAPLLFTSFGNSFWAESLDSPTASLPVQIFNYAISPYEEWHNKAWAGAFVLITLVFVISIIVRLITKNKFHQSV